MLEVINTFINDRYGSRRGLLNHWHFGVQYKLGQFAPCTNIDWSKVRNLVFICHGNICRSPLGEAVARQRFNLRAESFGLDCRDGAPADERAMQFARRSGIDLAAHESRHIRHYQPAESDLVIVMEPKHLSQLPGNIAGFAQITLLGLWKKSPWPYIHDPYSSKATHFDYCEQTVVNGVEGVASLWRSRHL